MVGQVGSRLIAGGVSGAMAASDDSGATWSWIDSGTTRDLGSIATGGGIAVIGCGDGVVLVSSDGGFTWAANTIAEFAGAAVQDVHHTGSKFVAAGSSGGAVIGTSTDGVTWAVATPGGELNSGKIASGNGRIVILAQIRTCHISTDDGATWLARHTPVQSCAGMTFIGDLFVAIDGSGYAHVSTNGEDWARGQQVVNSPKVAIGEQSMAAFSNENYLALTADGEHWEVSGYTEPGYTSVLSKFCAAITDNAIVLGMSGGSVMTLACGYNRATHFALPPAQTNTYIKSA